MNEGENGLPETLPETRILLTENFIQDIDEFVTVDKQLASDPWKGFDKTGLRNSYG